MNIVITNCNKINISSLLITEEIQDNTIISEVFYEINCCDNKTQLPLPVYMNDTYEYDVSSFNDGDTLLEGIYKFTIVYTYSDGSKVEETICKLITCNNLECKVIEHVANNDNSEAHLLYYILKNTECECNCDNMCIVYGKLLKLLNSPSDVSGVETNCTNGC